MRRSTALIALLIAGAALLFAFLPAAIPPAEARPDHQETCVYYSDATHQTIVGFCVTSCSGVTCSGTKTAFVQCSQGPSCQL